MGKRSRTERSANGFTSGDRSRSSEPALNTRRATLVRIVPGAVAAVLVGVALFLVMSGRRSNDGPTAPGNQAIAFTRVGRNGPVFTISVPRQNAGIDDQLMRIAEQLSAEEAQAGGSGQVSVMVWPDDAAVPKEPPTTEFDASMKTQIAGIFINPKLSVKHLIRFKDGATVSERDFGKPTR